MTKSFSAVWEKKKILFGLTKDKKEGSVLDFGAGNGAYIPLFLAQNRKVFCLENNEERISQLKSKFGLDKRVKILFWQKKHLPFKKKEFDLVWASEVLEHQPDFSLVDEWERVSRHLVVITVPHPLGPYWLADRTHTLGYSVATIRKYFSARPGFDYQIYGLGLCLPEKFKLVYLRRIFLRLTWKRPSWAWSWLILGKRKIC